jgi:CHAT domain-containing protein/tetratricopeptide (TPR) repeat protein
MGILKWDLGSMDESAEYFLKAKIAFEKAYDLRSAEFSEKCLELIELYEEGKKDRSSRLYYRSIERFEKSILICNEIGIADFKLKCIRQQALTYLAMRRATLYLERCEEGLNIAKTISHRIEQARLLNNIGIYYQQRSCFSQAIDNYERAIAILQIDGDPLTEAECLNNLGLVYRELGNLGRAEFYLSRALTIDRNMGSPLAICIDLENLGTVFLRKGIEKQSRIDLQRSFDLFREGLSLLSPAEIDHQVLIAALNNIGMALIKLKEYPEARRYLLRARSLCEGENHEADRSQVINNIALSYLEQQDAAEALTHYELAFELASKQSSDTVLLGCCFGLGQCYEKNKDFSRALFYYRKAVEIFEGQRSGLSAEPSSLGFARNKSAIYGKPIQILAALYATDPSATTLTELFNLAERAKARVFLEKVRESFVDESTESQSVLLERRETISQNIRELTRRLRERRLPEEEVRVLTNELGLEEEDYLRIASEIRLHTDRLHKEWGADIKDLRDVQGMLQSENAIVLEYYLDEPSSYLIWISRSKAGVCSLPARREIEESVRAYIRYASTRALDIDAGIRPAERIFRLLVPFDQDGNDLSGRALIVIPDGILCQLPFEALRIPSGLGSKYLIETTPVSYCPSASSLLLLRDARRRIRWKKDLLAVGGPTYSRHDGQSGRVFRKSVEGNSSIQNEPGEYLSELPFSKKEVVDISRFFASNTVDVLTGKDANETGFKHTILGDYRIIHLACHGILDMPSPLRSALILSQPDPSKEDGLLQTREIYGLAINAGMVVLSACQSGLGPLEGGEGLMAIARPFFFAGARSLVASLWPINDRATVFFMHEFYRYLVQGRSASESLQGAKISMLNSVWRHPFFWASFLLQGDPSAFRIGK